MYFKSTFLNVKTCDMPLNAYQSNYDLLEIYIHCALIHTTCFVFVLFLIVQTVFLELSEMVFTPCSYWSIRKTCKTNYIYNFHVSIQFDDNNFEIILDIHDMIFLE